MPTKTKPAKSPIRANARGEVRMGAHTLRFDFNAICDFEEIAGKRIEDLDFGRDPDPTIPGDTGTPSRVGALDVRALVQALGGFATAAEAGDAIQDVGIAEAAAAVGAAIAANGKGTPEADASGEA